MPSVTINISTRAHDRLKKNKLPGDSFSDVILREMPEPCDTAGELLDRLEHMEPPKINQELLSAVREGRGRRSNRQASRAK